MTHHSYSWAMSARWDRLAAVFDLIDSLNHASGQSFKAYPVLGSILFHWRRAIRQPPRLRGRSGIQTPVSGIVFASETAAVCSVTLVTATSGAGRGDVETVETAEFCSVVDKSEVDVGKEVVAGGFRRLWAGTVFNWEHAVDSEGVFNADMIVVPNMRNSWTVTGRKSVWSPMKLWSGSFCTGHRELP